MSYKNYWRRILRLKYFLQERKTVSDLFEQKGPTLWKPVSWDWWQEKGGGYADFSTD